ncbi:MAG: TRAM domain-containing protein [Acidimicrobiia bacterium]|nr:TRAM domain-containing protein [Acidimicrobiia bacterium]
MSRIVVSSMSSDGAGVGRDDDGRVVFVPGALLDETIEVEVVEEKKRHATARLVAVIDPSPDRIEPTCPMVAAGCGGCDMRHATPDAQRRIKELVVTDALTRIGRLDDPPAPTTVELAPDGHRSTVRCVVSEGRAGYRRRRSHEALIVDACPVVHPLLEELIVDGRYDGCTEVTLRVGARTGERLVLADPIAAGVHVPPDVVVVGADELRAGRRAWYHEEAAGRQWRISARSFFQARADGADALVTAVDEALGTIGEVGRDGHLVDLYGGVGLFAGSLGWQGNITLVERAASAVADARVNLAERSVKVLSSPVEKWRPGPAVAVVADPARKGLGRQGVEQIVGTGALRVVLVSCDAGALGRDAGLLTGAGYRLDRVTLVDLFPQTSRLEAVSRFVLG